MLHFFFCRLSLPSFSGEIFATWRRRYFRVLHFHTLAYFENEQEAAPLGEIDLLSASDVRPFGPADEFQFQLFTPERIWLFRAETSAALQFWIRCLGFLIERYRSPIGQVLKEGWVLKLAGTCVFLFFVISFVKTESLYKFRSCLF